MLINRPLSSASGPSSIALNTGLLGKDTVLVQLLGIDKVYIALQGKPNSRRFDTNE